MKLFDLPTLVDVCLLAFAATMILLVCNDKTLRKERKVLYSGMLCIVAGLLSVVAKLNPALYTLVLLMVGAFCLRFGARLLRCKNRVVKQCVPTEQTIPVVDAYFVDNYR